MDEIEISSEENSKKGKNIFFEYGAHFKYESLYDSLNNLKIRNFSINKEGKINDNKNNNEKNNVKSRNIKLNNQIRSINIYYANNKNKENKTSILNKTENLKKVEKIKNDLKKDFKIQLKNNNKINAKSTSHSKKIKVLKKSKNIYNNLLDLNSNSLKASFLNNKKGNYYNMKTENNNFKNKETFIIKNNKNSSQNKNRKIQIKKLIDNQINETSEIIKSINLNSNNLSLNKKLNNKLKDESNLKRKPKSTQSKNLIKQQFFKLSKNKSRNLSPKEKEEKLNNSFLKQNNFNKYDKLSKNIKGNSLKKKLKYSNINTSLNISNNKKNSNYYNPNLTISIDNPFKNKRNFSITKKKENKKTLDNLNISSSNNNKQILINSISQIKKKMIENSLIIKKNNDLKVNSKNKSFNICNNIKKENNKKDYDLIDKLRKEYQNKIDLIINKKICEFKK